MPNPAAFIILTGSLCVLISLTQAWCLSGMLILQHKGLKKLFPSYQNLLKSHIDYLLMSLLLFAFYLLFAHFDIAPHGALVIAMCLGSLINPFGFVLLAMKPDLAEDMPKPIGALVIGGFILTTVGYAGGALLVAKAVLS